MFSRVIICKRPVRHLACLYFAAHLKEYFPKLFSACISRSLLAIQVKTKKGGYQMTKTENIAPSASFSLKSISEQGVKLYIDGKLATADEITRRCVNEKKTAYMADYVLDNEGNLAEIRYDRVKNY
jgi:hypothetical protein